MYTRAGFCSWTIQQLIVLVALPEVLPLVPVKDSEKLKLRDFSRHLARAHLFPVTGYDDFFGKCRLRE